ncbi:hypothetical protein GF339_20095 [candidate division KSB3 bacterium]|uniref:Cobalt ABC transporter permease n=1 Tax=candidate division KSB3 bacterium TaxID=2044937 RepID=A0A9D5JZ23_9BACT|nr:hypothetical protein [candidate division KSB3 bacterium]
MPNSGQHTGRIRPLLSLVAVALILLGNSLPSEAHKVKMFAAAEGNVITGYVYYTTGGNPKDAHVGVQDTAGNPLAEVTADENGEFTFTAEYKRDYVFVLELADGHRTTFTLTAEELPDTLPAVPDALPVPANTKETSTPAEPTPMPVAQTVPSQAPSPSIALEELEPMIEKAVSKQIRPLREQLERYEEKIRLHDILGGIGYILGLMGLGYFLGARRKRSP